MKAATSARSLLILAITIAAVGLASSSMGADAAGEASETHGKLSVKLSEKFSLTIPKGTTGVTWSPDGSVLAVAGNYGMELSTFDSSGHLLNEFENNGNHGVTLQMLGFVNGSSQILFPVEGRAKEDAALDVRDLATGRIVTTLSRPRDKYFVPNVSMYLAVSPDQKRIAIGDGSGFVVFKTDDGNNWRELSIAQKGHFHALSLCFFPDSKLLAVGQNDRYFAVANSADGKILKEFEVYHPPIEGIDLNVNALAVSPNGDLILAGLGGGHIHGAALTTPGPRPSFEGTSIWRVSDGKQIANFPDKDNQIRQAVWDPKGRFVAFVDTDSLIVWQPEAPGENYIKLPYPNLAISLAINRDGKSLAVAEGAKVIVYNIENN